MNLLLSSEAEAAGQAMASPIVWVIYFAVLIGIFYFLFYRPQKKEQKKRSALINSVEVGDSVLTTVYMALLLILQMKMLLLNSVTIRTAVFQ